MRIGRTASTDRLIVRANEGGIYLSVWAGNLRLVMAFGRIYTNRIYITRLPAA